MVEKSLGKNGEWGEMTSEAIQTLLLANAHTAYSLAILVHSLPIEIKSTKETVDFKAMFTSEIQDLSVDINPEQLKYSHNVVIPAAPPSTLRGHPKDTLDLLHASQGQWIPRYIHRFKRQKEGVWGKWNDTQAGNKVYGFEAVKAFWYTGEKAEPAEASKPRQMGDPVMLHFHGGGYLCGTAAETDLTSSIPKALVNHSPIHHILSVDYRLAPTAPWPLPLLDAISAYHWLVQTEGVEERDIIVAGDSAGGHLALALTRWLRDEGATVGLRLPRGMVLMSPWADLGFTNAWGEEAIRHNKDSDTIDDTFGPFACALLLRALPAPTMHTSQYISPASLLIPAKTNGKESFENFPPTYIVYGGAERLSTNIQLLWDRIQLGRQKQMVPDRLFVSPDGVHDFMIFPWMAEEASAVYEDLDVWLRDLLAAELTEDVDHVDVQSEDQEEDTGWRDMITKRRLNRQMTRESLKSHKSPVMGPVRDDLGMMRMMEDMSEEGISMIGTGLPIPHFDLEMPKSPEWLTPLTAELRPEYGFDNEEIPWYDLDGSPNDEDRKDR
ncbi:uncharacterized protein L201_006798 [Kwoniella dendrophila CBS 6074]|uniref:Alpha/beta hydrolase fold-3 domain-containing protein n=1 Tax=Kwoniella dendrophila CBS 6074 TaxID=1295534 RepID=A0AAX4K2P0_9TREE